MVTGPWQAVAATAGNTYIVNWGTFRTPDRGSVFTFPGSKLAATRYAAAQELFDKQLAENCRHAKVDLIELPCAGEIVKPLMGFFQARGKRKSRG